MKRWIGRLAVALAAVAGWAVVGDTAAVAGTYEVHGCRLPDGTSIAAAGWDRSAAQYTAGLDTCRQGGYLEGYTQAPASHPAGGSIRYRFDAPDGTRVVRVRGHRWFYVRRPSSGTNIVIAGSTTPAAQGYQDLFCNSGCAGDMNLGSSSPWNAPGNAFDTETTTTRLVDSAGYHFSAACSSHASCPAVSGTSWSSGKAWMRIYRVQVTLRDETDPVPESVTGSLVSAAAAHRGVERLTVGARDEGGGVRSLVLEALDRETGTIRARLSEPVDDNDGACVDAYPTDGAAGEHRDYLRPVPCKLSVHRELAVDTRSFPDGVHDLRVSVEDAAGNSRVATVVEGWRVDNASAPVNAQAPSVLGDPAVGSLLVCDRGEWAFPESSEHSYAYRWQRSGDGGATWSDVPGATSRSHRASEQDAGRVVRCTVAARAQNGKTAEAVSAGAGPVRGSSGVSSPGGTAPGAPGQAVPAAGGPNGPNASDRAVVRLLGKGGRVRVRYGRRAIVRGVLEDDRGRPIEGATIRIQRRTDGSKRFIDAGGVRTRAGGRFTWITRKGPSRTLRAAYAHVRGSTDFRYSNDLRVEVSAGVRMRADRTVRNGRTARYKGRVLGRVPRGGVLVELQVRVGGRWRTFRTARTRAGGRFIARYRFRRTFRPTTFRFRARVRGHARFPYQAGASRPVLMRVVP